MNSSTGPDSQQAGTPSNPTIEASRGNSQSGSYPQSQPYISKLATETHQISKALLDATFAIDSSLKISEFVRELLRLAFQVVAARRFINAVEYYGYHITFFGVSGQIANMDTKRRIEAWIIAGSSRFTLCRAGNAINKGIQIPLFEVHMSP
ncbi:hypothetical protein G7Y79_00006g018330 [Physcia stellaris]|nr:hypothetical protein G7Y79_00006g018330 [Physcia stellaris]